ncbi:hypothetical protein GGR54DRAFT_585051 [Hypoxylon sp. NC1633]|nr:hypothetical protein GGR54DRAFT_585051 [Hypoxylon sp. NC1633]
MSRWLLDSAEFVTWVEAEKQVLTCPGLEYDLKQTTSRVVDELVTRFGDDESVGIAYLYLENSHEGQQKPVDLLASLLRQLIQRRSVLPDSIQSLYDKHNKDERTRPSFNEISLATRSVASLYSRIFILFNYLRKHEGQDALLSELSKLRKMYRTNIFVTSEYDAGPMRILYGNVQLKTPSYPYPCRR